MAFEIYCSEFPWVFSEVLKNSNCCKTMFATSASLSLGTVQFLYMQCNIMQRICSSALVPSLPASVTMCTHSVLTRFCLSQCHLSDFISLENMNKLTVLGLAPIDSVLDLVEGTNSPSDCV